MKKRAPIRLTMATAAVVALFAVFATTAMALGTATTEGTTGVTSTKAVLHGYAVGNPVDPVYHNLPAQFSYVFEYGTTTEYGMGTEYHESRYGVHTEEALSGLEPHTIYHYRIVVWAKKGYYANEKEEVLFGEDKTFTTQPLPSFRSPATSSYIASGNQSEANPFRFQVPGQTAPEVKCGTVNFTSPSSGMTTALDLNAEYGGCQLWSGGVLSASINAAIHMNSCQYVSNVTKAGPPYVGTLGIACGTEGDKVDVELIYASTGKLMCRFGLAPQGPVGGISYSNAGSGNAATVTESVSASGLSYTTTGPACGLFKGNGNDASLSWGTVLSATDSKTGAASGLEVAGLPE